VIIAALTRCGDIVAGVEGDDNDAKVPVVINSPDDLGLLLAGTRRRLHRSQSELAETLGIQRKYLYELEHGKPGLLTERLFALLAELDIDLYARAPR
jgi:HTH-type transcriptional regulator/antitoxin HipB